MLILKGDCGKSKIVDIMMDKTDSICFVYNDYPLIYNAFGIDSRLYSLKDFLKCISDGITKAVIDDKHYDYLLVYTNQSEEDLKDIIDWLDKYRWNINCRDIILTCK